MAFIDKRYLDLQGLTYYDELLKQHIPIVHGYYDNGTFYSDSAKTTAITPEEKKLYVDLANNKIYEYKNNAYTEVGSAASATYESKPAAQNGTDVSLVTTGEKYTWNSKVDSSSLGTAAAKDVPTSGDASSTQVVMGDDSRLTDARTPTTHSHNLNQISNAGSAAAKDYTTSVTQNSGDLVTSGAVWTAIDNLPEPMIFKGTLGTGGTITSLPTAASGNLGYTYKVITAGTYASVAAKVGDVFVSDGSSWVLIPAGDTDSDTWRNIKVNGTEVLGSAISTGAVNFKSGTNATVSASGNDITISATDTTYESKTAANGGTDVSLVTTGEKYTWNNKQNALTLPLSTANGGTGNSDGYIRTGQKSGTTIGTGATAEGGSTTASGSYAHAEGSSTIARNAYSHAEGLNTTASSECSHAEGASSVASGRFSHAEGGSTTASGQYSHAGGRGTTAGYEGQTAIGKYNDNKSTTLFEIGNGTDKDNTSNAFEVHSNGNVVITGDLSILKPSPSGGAILKIGDSSSSDDLPNKIELGDGSNAYISEYDDDSLEIYASDTLKLTGDYITIDSEYGVDGTAVDSAPTSGSDNLVTSGGVNTALAAKQNKLTAGTGIAISGNNVITATGGGGSATKWYYITGGVNPIGTNIAHSFYTGGYNQTKFIEVRVLAPQSSAFTSLGGFISYIWNTGVVMLMQDKSNGSTTTVLWTRVGVAGGGYLLLVGEWDSYSTSFADNDYSRASYVLKVSPGMVDSLTDTVSSWGGGLYKHKIKIQFASPATYLARGGTHTKNGDYVIGYTKTEGIVWA